MCWLSLLRVVVFLLAECWQDGRSYNLGRELGQDVRAWDAVPGAMVCWLLFCGASGLRGIGYRNCLFTERLGGAGLLSLWFGVRVPRGTILNCAPFCQRCALKCFAYARFSVDLRITH